MPVVINDTATVNAINRLKEHVGDPRRAMEALGAGLTRYVQDTIRGGGRNRPYAPLSTWTVRRTGRTQPLLTLVPRFSYSATRDVATIFFRTPPGKSFSIDAHHRGFTTPERIGRPVMAVPLFGGGAVYFKHARKSKIPAREIWPTKAEAGSVVRQAIATWLREGRDLWR